MTDRLVKLDRQGAIAVITLSRSDRHNALIPELLSELLEALEKPHCRQMPAIVLRAEGRSFSTGGDILGFQRHRDQIADYAFKLVDLLNQTILALYRHPAVVICSVQGQVTGGSLGLLLASDWVVMRRDVTITPWYANLGFSPDGGWTALLPEIIGRQQAAQWLANNTSCDAQFCLDSGLVHQIVDADSDAAAMARATQVTAMHSAGVYETRPLFKLDSNELLQRLHAERDAFVLQIQTQQALEGIDQFLRRP